MDSRGWARIAIVLLALVAGGDAFAGEGRHVVLVSVDGLRPETYLRPDRLGATLPTFAALRRRGAFAEGVVGVFPSVTYPTHTSLVTGVRPARHGIVNNYIFDPKGRFADWYWYAEALRAPTLWDAARAAGATTAAVSWPVTVGAAIDWSFPEIWRPAGGETFRETALAVASPDLVGLVEAELGRIPDEAPEGAALEAFLFDVAEVVLRRRHPNLLLLHVYATDSAQHAHGRSHPEVARAFERTDRRLEGLLRAVEETGLAEDTLVVVTGDHGFMDVHSTIRPNALLAAAGLLETAADGTVARWRALAWPAGGACGLVLADPGDGATAAAARAVIERAVAGPLGGAMRIVTEEERASSAAMPEAFLLLEAKEGYVFSGSPTGPVVGPASSRGHHGYWPERRRMETGFLMVGPGVRPGLRVPGLRTIDVAPTVAAWAGWPLADVEGLVLRGLFEEGALARGEADERDP